MLARRADGGAVTLGDEAESSQRWRIERQVQNGEEEDVDVDGEGNKDGEKGVFIGLLKVVGSNIVEALESLFSSTDPPRKTSIHSNPDSTSSPRSRTISKAMGKELRRKSMKMRNQKARKDAIIKFNIKPKNAIEYLREHGGMICNPREFAEWIYEFIESLSKKKIGEFLGNTSDYNKATLKSFLQFHDFTSLPLSDALRQLLRTFRLPGEAQQIDRILEKFAERYRQCNKEDFRCEDGAYVLAFSIIMLNTDLHNRSIPEHKKMKMEEFIRNNRGIDDGQDPPREMLERIYIGIKEDEIVMNESDMYESDVVTFIAPHKAGWLDKKGKGTITKWKRHWFVLADSCLYYFLKATDDDPRCIIPLDNTRVGRGDGRLEIKLTSADGLVMKTAKNLPDGRMEIGDRKEFILRAASSEERETWVKLLQSNLDRSPIGKAVAQKQMVDNIVNGVEDLTLPPIELPPAKSQGWMKKRGENNTAWRNRYFCVFEDECSSMLYYYGSKEMAQRMMDLGDETHKGCLDLRAVEKMCVSKEKNDVVLDLQTASRTWHFSTDKKEVLAYWIEVFTGSCPMLQDKERVESNSSSSFTTASNGSDRSGGGGGGGSGAAPRKSRIDTGTRGYSL
ncbi:hypothetical protein TrLO_g912 [Triparma laevis f. longispina]|uniref:Uncharacterized protein n=1 Tax=Triparma laevis f. longispina TaxID=1714387 RepID=A0A9W7E0E8_9STRA|nr:hypothetical protein TrLO_g912 [Triparma laevis f. longispina]